MAGFGKNQRMGKRSSGAASTSSPLYCVTVVIFVTFCGLGVWMLTSSSIIHSQAASGVAASERLSWATSSKDVTGSRASRVVAYRDPPPAMEDTQGDLPEDAIKGDVEEEEKRDTKLELAVQKSEKRSAQEEEEESGGSEEGGKEEGLRQEQRDGSGENENREQSTGESKKEEGRDGGQHRDGNVENGAEDNNNEEQQSEDIHERHQREHDEQMPSGDGEERQQDSQQQQQEEEQQQSESVNDVNQEKTEELTHEDSDSKFDEKIQEVTDENPNKSHGGMEEGGNDSHQTEETEGISEDGEQKSSERQKEEESHTANGEEGRQGESDEKLSDPNAAESLPDGTPMEVSNENDGEKRPWATQADQSDNEKERRKDEELQSNNDGDSGGNIANLLTYEWKLCNVTAGPDYIPCLDNIKAIKKLHSLRHYEHRERHCPEESPTCLVFLPDGYKRSIEWPKSRDKIWYNNVPRTKLAEVKGHQNWVKVTGEFLTFPGGGTQFIHGALHYIDFIQQSVRDIAWGKHTRVILDVGCGVASFGGYLFERDVLAMSFAPKDEHEAQVQFALERGIPAISAVMGSQRLPFPSKVFDIVHCARCRVPWHADGGALLLELNRVLRPGGYFVWSATPVYQKLEEDVEIWKAMKILTRNMCWDLVTIKKDKLNGVGAAFFRKPTSNECYHNRKHHSPPMCNEDDDPNAAWYIPLKACMHEVPVDASERGTRWPEEWPRRLQVPPYWLNSSQTGIYGKQAPEDFTADYEHWKRVVSKSYLNGLGIDWSRVRNIMDMRAVYGGFAAALRDMKVWVMNVVNIDDADTLPIIYERGFFGIYHDWCESFSTYPRTYDLLHADHLFSRIKKRCEIVPVIAEVDRIVRPGGKIIVRDDSVTISEVENLLKSLHWEVRLTFSKDQEGILSAEKSDWRPQGFADSS